MAVQGSKITVEVSDGSPLAGVTVAVSPSVFLTSDMTGSPVDSVVSNALGLVVCWALPGSYTFIPAQGNPIVVQFVNDTIGGDVPESTVAALTTLIAEKLGKAQNLDDLGNVSDARENLGLGSAAVEDSEAFAAHPRGAAAPLSLFRKIRGGNIVPKPSGGAWPSLFAEWDWNNWIKPQVDRAVALGLNAVRLIGGPSCIFVAPASLATITQATYDAHWEQLAAYCLDRGVYLYPALTEVSDFVTALGTSANFQDAALTASIQSTAAALAGYSNVIGFDTFQEGDGATGIPWTASTVVVLNRVVNHDSGKSYICTTAGTTASSGGPTGTGASITDGTAVWAYQRQALQKADVLALMAAIRQIAPTVPLTMSRSLSDGFGWNDTVSLWYQVFTDPAGADHADVHLYGDGILPSDPDFLLQTTGKPLLIGEFGADQSLSSGTQSARYAAIAAIHNRSDVLGSFVWALADQSATTSQKFGVWDNTGFAQTFPAAPTAPLSVTAGRRATLTALLPTFLIANRLPTSYVGPNLLTPNQARPRLVTESGSGWNDGANTFQFADERGLGFSATAAGTTSIGSGGPKAPVVTAHAYTAVVTLLAAVARRGTIEIDWYDSSNSFLTSSNTVLFVDHPDQPTTVALIAVSPANSAFAVIVVKITDQQLINEATILVSASLRQSLYDSTPIPGQGGPLAWQAPTLSGSWANVGGTTTPAGYRITADGKSAELAGDVSGGTGAILTLPPDYRPIKDKIRAVGDDGNNFRNVIKITASTGVVSYLGSSTSVNIDCVFPLDR